MKNISKVASIIFLLILSLGSCSENETFEGPSIPDNPVDTPTSYTFLRNGASTVNFNGQTTRIAMATELSAALIDFENTSSESLLEMFRNQTTTGQDANPFKNEALNESSKSIKNKIAASYDYYSSNTVGSQKIKNDFESWMLIQIKNVFPNTQKLAQPGQAGQIADGNTVRYITGSGVEMNQIINKGLIGALMLDQIVNNYLSSAILDANNNVENNNTNLLEEGKNYTTMEHKWDEAYGYLFGESSNPMNPISSIGSDDSFLNKYVGRVNEDPDYFGISQKIFDAFALGREAIVQKRYDVRDNQAKIIQELLSSIIAIRSIFYLSEGANLLDEMKFGSGFHNISEAFGFVYSLQFTKNTETGQPYFTGEEIDIFLDQFLTGNGLYNLDTTSVLEFAKDIAVRFDLDFEHAKN